MPDRSQTAALPDGTTLVRRYYELKIAACDVCGQASPRWFIHRKPNIAAKLNTQANYCDEHVPPEALALWAMQQIGS